MRDKAIKLQLLKTLCRDVTRKIICFPLKSCSILSYIMTNKNSPSVMKNLMQYTVEIKSILQFFSIFSPEISLFLLKFGGIFQREDFLKICANLHTLVTWDTQASLQSTCE